MLALRILFLTTLTMLAFAGNSLLCRLALKQTQIDAASFTVLRLLSGAVMLSLLVYWRQGRGSREGNMGSALALFTYAACFSLAYIQLSAASGALLLFGAVQATMIGYGFWRGERLRPVQGVGFGLALLGLVGLLLPGLSAPPLLASGLMLLAGVSWGVYSLRGRGAGDPLAVSAGNFVRSVPFALLLLWAGASYLTWDVLGAVYAVASGAIASGLGYALWYTVLPALPATTAATVQLSVPVLAALGGVVFLGEVLTGRLLWASVAILGGIGLVIWQRRG